MNKKIIRQTMRRIFSISLSLLLLVALLATTPALATSISLTDINWTAVDISAEMLAEYNAFWDTDYQSWEEVPDSQYQGEPEHFYPDEMTEPEIEIVIERMLRGENVIFGDGVAPDYEIQRQRLESESSEARQSSSGTRWGSGNNNGHQLLTLKALAEFNRIAPSSHDYNAAEIAAIVSGSDYPDIWDNTPLLFNDYHFYYVPSTTYGTTHKYFTSSNSFGNYDAATRAMFWFDHAKSGSSIFPELQSLGASLHYVQDICVPVHTGQGNLSLANPVAILQALNEHDDWEGGTNAIIAARLYSKTYNPTLAKSHSSATLQTHATIAANDSYSWYVYWKVTKGKTAASLATTQGYGIDRSVWESIRLLYQWKGYKLGYWF